MVHDLPGAVGIAGADGLYELQVLLDRGGQIAQVRQDQVPQSP